MRNIKRMFTKYIVVVTYLYIVCIFILFSTFHADDSIFPSDKKDVKFFSYIQNTIQSGISDVNPG